MCLFTPNEIYIRMNMMMNDNQRMLVRKHGTLVARILIGMLFLIAGWQKVGGLEGTAGYIESVGLPFAFVLAVIATIIELGGGLSLILGYRIGVGAGALFIFAVAAAFLFHGPNMWADAPMQQGIFLKDLAIAGGLLYILAYGPGVGWSLGKKKATQVA